MAGNLVEARVNLDRVEVLGIVCQFVEMWLTAAGSSLGVEGAIPGVGAGWVTPAAGSDPDMFLAHVFTIVS